MTRHRLCTPHQQAAHSRCNSAACDTGEPFSPLRRLTRRSKKLKRHNSPLRSPRTNLLGHPPHSPPAAADLRVDESAQPAVVWLGRFCQRCVSHIRGGAAACTERGPRAARGRGCAAVWRARGRSQLDCKAAWLPPAQQLTAARIAPVAQAKPARWRARPRRCVSRPRARTRARRELGFDNPCLLSSAPCMHPAGRSEHARLRGTGTLISGTWYAPIISCADLQSDPQSLRNKLAARPSPRSATARCA